MSKRTRCNQAPPVKAKVALTAVKGEKTQAELAQQFDVQAGPLSRPFEAGSETMDSSRYGFRTFHIQSSGDILRDGFPFFDHHDAVSQLWHRKWRGPCEAGAYPFGEGSVADFEPIFAELTRMSEDDPSILGDADLYAKPFHTTAESLVSAAERAEAEGRIEAAKTLFFRAATVYRISRFPIPRTALGRSAWEKGKKAFARGARHLHQAPEAISIVFTHRSAVDGDSDAPIEADLWLPASERPRDGWPLIVFVCGLDGFRTDVLSFVQAHLASGFATLCVEIPGTGDCPAAPNDPRSPDRWMSSILGWAKQSAGRFDLQPRIFLRGVSTGGYYALRAAHTHSSDLFAVVAQGGAAHHAFDPTWIRAQNQMEYPFGLADALAYKFGYRGGGAREAYAAEAHKFSLLTTGLLEKPSSRLLVINGMEDSVFPVEDSILAATRSKNKELHIVPNRAHMGDPEAEEVIHRWLKEAAAASC